MDNNKIYNLEERTLVFAKNIRDFVRKLPNSIANSEDIRQLVRSSGSVGANYIEACDCLSKKDFALRIKISRKEAKETIFWLKLILTRNEPESEVYRNKLIDEATQLMKIFGAILNKTKDI